MNARNTRSSVGSASRILVLGGIGLSLLVVSFGDAVFAGFLRPNPKHDSGPHVRAEPSCDGRWLALETVDAHCATSRVEIIECATGRVCALDRQYTALSPIPWSADGLLRARVPGSDRVDWIDPRTLAATKSTPDHDGHAQGLAASGDGWSDAYRGGQSLRASDGRAIMRITWRERGLTCDLDDSPSKPWRTSRVPGIVYQALRGARSTEIVRHDLEHDEAATIATLEQNGGWRISNDGERILCSDHSGLRVLAAQDGREIVHLPSAVSAWWIEGGHDRLVVQRADGQRFVHEVETGADVRVGDNSVPHCIVHVLPGERLLVQTDEEVRILRADGGLERLLARTKS